MKRSWTMGVVAVLAVVLAGWKGRASQIQSQPATPVVTASEPKAASNQEINDAFVQQIPSRLPVMNRIRRGRYSRISRSIFLRRFRPGGCS